VHEAPIKNVANLVFLTTASFGNQSFTAVIDTGSSDTWIIGTPFTCMSHSTNESAAGEPIANAACRFGHPYRLSSTWVDVADQEFVGNYADGEVLEGRIGRETVRLGGVLVTNQTVGLVNKARWTGDGISSGLVGMAFPSFTKALLMNSSTPIVYDPVFFNMWKKEIISPVFSLALNRPDEEPGTMALGGLPAAAHIRYRHEWARAPMEHVMIAAHYDLEEVGEDKRKHVTGMDRWDYALYAVNVTGFEIGDKELELTTRVIIDSGTTMSFLPEPVVSAMAAAFQPPAQILDQVLLVECAAEAPVFGIKFGERTIYIDGEDLIMRGNKTQSICALSIQAPSTEKSDEPETKVSLLGGPFLRSVVTVFDVGAAELRFANRIR
jgi:hypothetical protein